MVRHRHRVLRRADRHRLAHLGRARHADQHRHRDVDHPHRLDRRRHGGVRHRVAWPGAGNDARAGDRRASRLPRRGRARAAGRQRRGAGRHRHLCEPQHRAGGRRRDGLPPRACARRCSTPPRICSRRRPPISSPRAGASRSPARIASVTFRDVARAVYSDMARLPAEAREELAATRTYDPVFGTTTSATHIAAVEIDPETYQVRVDRFVVAEDCGRIINPLIVDGQVHGGVAQGIGAALYEEIVYDAEGQLHTASLVDYLVPSACEIPPIDVVHLETLSPTTLGGFRGMGEGGTIGAPAAVANAIADALAPLGDRDQRASRHARTPVPPDHGTPAERLNDGCWIERQGCAGHRRGTRASDARSPHPWRAKARASRSTIGRRQKMPRRLSPRSRRPAERPGPIRPTSRISPP